MVLLCICSSITCIMHQFCFSSQKVPKFRIFQFHFASSAFNFHRMIN
eukprot:13349.XXX_286267_286407_1 [CDS] Oithona nana genome sequencing.